MLIFLEFNRKRCILRTILTILAIVIAESVPRFDLVMSLIGGTLIGPLVFILPPLFYIKMTHLYRNFTKRLKNDSFTNIVLTQPQEEYSRWNIELAFWLFLIRWFQRFGQILRGQVQRRIPKRQILEYQNRVDTVRSYNRIEFFHHLRHNVSKCQQCRFVVR